MGDADDVLGGMSPEQRAAWDAAGDTMVFGPGLARAVRRAAMLAGLVPLGQMTEDEVAWVFSNLVQPAGHWVSRPAFDCGPR